MTSEEAAAVNQQLTVSYRLMFTLPTQQIALQDLQRFCRYRVGLVDDGEQIDALTLARREGRREVFVRITQMSRLTEEQLLALYQGRTVTFGENDDG